jgi:plastocyanin
MNRTSRRRFLAGIGTASAALAAGCSSGSSSGGSGDSANGTDSTASNETAGASAGETSGDGTATASTTGNPDGATAGTDATTGASGGTTVVAGPDGRFVFAPEEVEVSVGDTVVWEFESPNHNVSAVPQDSEEVNIPNGATPFASYESGNLYAVVDEGETYEHTFETPGEYTYVCIPHVASGMVGTVTVTE